MTAQSCPTFMHRWGSEYHTHLGHELYGAHTRHWDCKKCGWIKSQSVSGGDVSYAEAWCKEFWRILPVPHECAAGWRGVSVYSEKFEGGE